MGNIITKTVTKKSTWNDILMGLSSGGLQGVGTAMTGATFGSFLSAILVGALPNAWGFVSETNKSASIVNLVTDATANLLVGN